MCGLYGWYEKKRGTLTGKQKSKLTLALAFKTEVRGTDSYSLLTRNSANDKLCTIKNIGTWKRERQRSKYDNKYISKACMVMGHNRYGTHGSKTLDNSHAFQCGNLIMSHNGVINSLDKYKRETLILPKGETDSETVLTWIVSRNKGIYGFLDIDTSNDAFTVYDTKDNSLYLITKGKNLYVIETLEFVVYASESEIVETSVQCALGIKASDDVITSEKIVKVSNDGLQLIKQKNPNSVLYKQYYDKAYNQKESTWQQFEFDKEYYKE